MSAPNLIGLKVYFLLFSSVCLIPFIQIGCNTSSGGAGVWIAGNVNESKNVLSQRYEVKEGFERVTCAQNSFGQYLRSLKLKPHGSKVHYYDGTVKPNNDVYDAVIDMEIGTRDLQQCADAVMRLRGEYLFEQKSYSQLHFNFTSGFNCEFTKWKDGYRVTVSGSKVNWVKKASPSASYETFRSYMNKVFEYAGTLSLSKEMKKKNIGDMEPGDVLIKGGSPGHAVIVLDMIVNTKTKQKYFMLAQSYMPAQEIQVLLNPSEEGNTVWYKLDVNADVIQTPEWKFTKNDLKCFE